MSLYSQKQTNTLERSAFMLCQALKVKEGQLEQEVWCECAISESSSPLSTLPPVLESPVMITGLRPQYHRLH